MKKLTLLVLVLVLVGCENFESLEAGNRLAIENQANLETNSMRAINNLKLACQAYAKAAGKEWTAEDEGTWAAQQNELATQLAINKVWLIVIEEATKQDSLNADLFGSLIADIPGWIMDGKDVYDLVKTKK